jgi:hypothetical protein
VVNIYDDRGEKVATLCGNVFFTMGSTYSASLSSFVPSVSGLGGSITIYLNNQPIAVWNAVESNGQLVPNGFYHFKITENAPEGITLILERDAFIESVTGAGELQMSARPNIVHPGETVTILASYSGNPPDGKSKIRIYDMAGELLETLSLLDGIATWDLKNPSGREVGTGLYLAAFDGNDPVTGSPEHKVIKILYIH